MKVIKITEFPVPIEKIMPVTKDTVVVFNLYGMRFVLPKHILNNALAEQEAWNKLDNLKADKPQIVFENVQCVLLPPGFDGLIKTQDVQ